jgi:hypothetical protein
MLLQTFLMLALAATLLLSGATNSAGPVAMTNEREAVEKTPFPLGVADAGGRVGYVFEPAKTTLAVDLATGAPLWRTEHGTFPLLATEHHLIAARVTEENHLALQVSIHNVAASGQLVLRSEPIALPDWLEPDAINRGRLACRASLRNHGLVLRWQAFTRYEGGAPPPPFIAEAAAKEASGAVIVDLRTGALTQGDDVAHEPSRELPTGAAGSCVPYFVASGWRAQPWRVGENTAALVSEERDGRQILKLRIEGPHEPPVETVIGETEQQESPPHVSLDGRLVFFPRPSPPMKEDSYQIISAETANPIGMVTLEPGAQDLGVLQERLFYVFPSSAGLSLGARVLPSGAPLWQQPLATPEPSPPPRLRW